MRPRRRSLTLGCVTRSTLAAQGWLAGVRDNGRVLRLLPRLPRVLEAVRPWSAGRRVEEVVLRERAETHAMPATERLAALDRRRMSREKFGASATSSGPRAGNGSP